MNGHVAVGLAVVVTVTACVGVAVVWARLQGDAFARLAGMLEDEFVAGVRLVMWIGFVLALAGVVGVWGLPAVAGYWIRAGPWGR